MSEEGPIEHAALLVDQLSKENARVLEQRYARQTRVRQLDELLERFETLNVRGARKAPVALTHDVYKMALEDRNSLLCRPLDKLSISDWIDVVWKLQDPWLLPAEDKDDRD